MIDLSARSTSGHGGRLRRHFAEAKKSVVRASMALNRQQMANPRRERQAIFLGATEPRAAETSLLI